MQSEPGEEREEIGGLISGMGRERVELRARRAAMLLTLLCSFVCLGTALGGFTGYVMLHAVGPATVFLLASVAGFVLSVTVAGRSRG